MLFEYCINLDATQKFFYNILYDFIVVLNILKKSKKTNEYR